MKQALPYIIGFVVGSLIAFFSMLAATAREAVGTGMSKGFEIGYMTGYLDADLDNLKIQTQKEGITLPQLDEIDRRIAQMLKDMEDLATKEKVKLDVYKVSDMPHREMQERTGTQPGKK